MQQLDPPLIDVYIIHWRAPDWCVRTAAGVLESTDVHVRCHVIDNGATGGDDLARALDPRVEVITSAENRGYTGAANLALGLALAADPPAEFIVVASHDLQVQPATFRELSAVTRADAQVGIVGPVLTAPAISAGGTWRGWRAQPTTTWDAARAFEEREWISGTLLFLRPDCVRAIGGLDEALGSYVEDVDLCLRARDAGWRVGIATAARATGIGSAATNVTVMVDVNSLLLAVKRGGIRACFGILARYAYWVPRGIVAGMVPGRDRPRRRASFAHARDHARALAQVAREWRRVRRIARAPEAGVPRFG